MEEGSENVKYIDAEAYSGGSNEKITFREIVLSHLRKISTYASVEFRGGYWEIKETPVSVGSGTSHTVTNKIYIPDSREVYSNSVEYLYDILYPHFDKQMEKIGEEAEELMDEAYKKYTVARRKDKVREGEEADREFKDTSDKVTFRNERRLINRQLFREICCFLKRKDYLKGKEFEEEI